VPAKIVTSLPFWSVPTIGPLGAARRLSGVPVGSITRQRDWALASDMQTKVKSVAARIKERIGFSSRKVAGN
jgi:hypothetical protein